MDIDLFVYVCQHTACVCVIWPPRPRLNYMHFSGSLMIAPNNRYSYLLAGKLPIAGCVHKDSGRISSFRLKCWWRKWGEVSADAGTTTRAQAGSPFIFHAAIGGPAIIEVSITSEASPPRRARQVQWQPPQYLTPATFLRSLITGTFVKGRGAKRTKPRKSQSFKQTFKLHLYRKKTNYSLYFGRWTNILPLLWT